MTQSKDVISAKYRKYCIKFKSNPANTQYAQKKKEYEKLCAANGIDCKAIEQSVNAPNTVSTPSANGNLEKARSVVERSRQLRSKFTGGSASAMRAFMTANADNPNLVNQVTMNLEGEINDDKAFDKMMFSGGSASAMRAFMTSNADNPNLVNQVSANLEHEINTDKNNVDRILLVGGADNGTYEDALSKLDSILKEFNNLPQSNTNVASQLSDAKNAVNSVQDQQKETVDDILDKVAKINVTDESKTQRIKDLMREIEMCRKEIGETETGTSESANKIAELESVIAELERKLADCESELTNANTDMDNMQRTLDEINNEKESNVSEIATLTATIADLQGQIDATDDQARIDELQSELDTLNNRMSDLEGMNDELTNENDTLSNLVKSREQQIADLERELSELGDQRTNNTNECDELRRELDIANNLLDDLGTKLDQAVAQLEDIKNAHEVVISDNRDLSEALDDAVNKFAQVNQDANTTLVDIQRNVDRIRSRQESEINTGELGINRFVGGMADTMSNVMDNMLGGAKQMEALIDTEDLAIPEFDL